MVLSKSSTKAVILVLAALCGILLYVSNRWVRESITGYNERISNAKLALIERADKFSKEPMSTSGKATSRSTSTDLESLSVKDSEEMQKSLGERSQSMLNGSLQDTPVVKDAVNNDLAEKYMSIIADERLAGLQRGCHVNQKKFGLDVDAIFKLEPAHRPRFYFSDKHKLLLCEVPKCGSTSWKRAMLTMEDVISGKKPDEIGGGDAHTFGAYLNLWKNYNESDESSVAKTKERISNYTRVMTVREPLERLVSAYKDKMLPTGTGGSSFGSMSKKIHQLYSQHLNTTEDKDQVPEKSHASWKEFIRYILDKKRKIYIDAHWQLFSRMCYPCSVAYHYIAKLETISQDTEYISRLIEYDITPFFPVSKEKGRHHKWSTEYQNYFGELSKDDRERLYDMYVDQYDLFGYSRPKFL